MKVPFNSKVGNFSRFSFNTKKSTSNEHSCIIMLKTEKSISNFDKLKNIIIMFFSCTNIGNLPTH